MIKLRSVGLCPSGMKFSDSTGTNQLQNTFYHHDPSAYMPLKCDKA